MKILTLFLILLFSCSHAPKRRVDIKGSYEANVGDLILRNSFAFTVDGHEYYFATKVDRESGFDCEFYIGFVDGKFNYAFPASRMAELEVQSSEMTTPEARISHVVSRLEEFKRNDFLYLCSDKFKITSETVATLVAYSPLRIFLGPLLYTKDLALQADNFFVNLDHLRLGMSLNEVKKIIHHRPLEARKEIGFELLVFDQPDGRVVMYFKGTKLFAWARGFKPEGFTFAPAPRDIVPKASLQK